ncbi:hypothetical protein CVT24_002137 [Panaeolus cyanescens]|uniref:Type 2A phosphatase activator TIP41 n=1 Tax=Panaeolus cyanescens TaxID=181874 RepID=A0A409YI43_9AGAR|nr:hypothetical protein CVT24_002137 [Panaeolus cyanescens]
MSTHQLFESPNSRTIKINGWHITASTNPISNAAQCDQFQAALGIPLPEMTFGNNYLTLHHQPSNWKYSFSAYNALKAVKAGQLEEGDGSVKVGYAEKTTPASNLPMPKTVAAKPYDWTFTTVYPGHQSPDAPGSADDDDGSEDPESTESKAPSDPKSYVEKEWKPADLDNPSNGIPLAELSRPDPILFYAEIPLFEDELHDNGASSLLVRIRVMPTCFFILSRFTLRVDNVLFRTYDTRIYHSFASPDPKILVRERSAWEAPYSVVKQFLPKRNDLTPLTDPTFIAKVLTELPKHISQREGAKTGWRALGTKTEITLLN